MSNDRVARWLVPAALVSVVPFLGKVPVIDEESYLWLGAHVSWLRPYDWHRVWQPYVTPDAAAVSDSFIYAHPPLFLWFLAALHAVAPFVWLARILASVPFVALFGWGVARWARLTTKHPSLAAGLWLSSACVQLALQDSLMIDLPAVALVTAGLALYREGMEEGERLWAAGLVLGLAVATKYSMGMVVVPVLLHLGLAMLRRRLGWQHALSVVVPLLAVPALGEAAMFAVYGRVHIWEVIAHRGDIVSGPAGERLLGILARMALLPLPLVLLYVRPALAAAGVVVGLLTMVAIRPAGLASGDLGLLLGCVTIGGIGVVRAIAGVAAGPRRRRKGDRDDALLLGAVVLGVGAGVLWGHNYASARYLLPAAAPLAILVVRSAEEAAGGKTGVRVSILLSVVLALVLAVADYRFGRSGVEVATMVADRVEKRAPPDKRFAGEWSFRYTLEQRGWTRYIPGEVLAPGTLIAVAEHESPGELTRSAWEPIDRVESVDHFVFRVMLPGRAISMYSETLGVLPFGIAGGPLETATVYRVEGTTVAPQ